MREFFVYYDEDGTLGSISPIEIKEEIDFIKIPYLQGLDFMTMKLNPDDFVVSNEELTEKPKVSITLHNKQLELVKTGTSANILIEEVPSTFKLNFNRTEGFNDYMVFFITEKDNPQSLIQIVELTEDISTFQAAWDEYDAVSVWTERPDDVRLKVI